MTRNPAADGLETNRDVMGQRKDGRGEGDVLRPETRFEGAAAETGAQEHALFMAMESTSDAVIVYDRDWRCTYLNTRAKKLYGRDYLGEVVWDVFPSAVGGPFYEAYQRAVRTWMPVRVEAFAAGAGRHLEVNAYPSETGLTVFAHDVTEERRLAASLRDREQLFRVAFEQAAVGIVVLRADMTALEVNEAFCRIAGTTRDEALSRSSGGLASFLDCGAQSSAWESLLSGAVEHIAYETRYVGKDRGVRFASISMSRISDPERCASRYLGVVQDVTEQKQAEAARREFEERMRLFIESAPASIAQFDRDMCYLAASRRWREDYGLAENVVGRSHYDVFPDLPEVWKEMNRRSMAGETMRSEGDRFERFDGTEQWVRSETLPWRGADGEIGGILIGTEDVTERMRAEQELRDSEAKLRSVFEQAAVGIALSEGRPNGKLLRVNDKLCGMLGYSREELLVRGFTDITHPDDRPANAERVNSILSGEVANYAMEKRYLHRDGSTVWVNNAISLVRDAAGKPDYFVAVLKDVTERRRAEESLRLATERFHLALRAGPIVLFSQDVDLRYTWIHNPVLGYDATGVVGKRDLDLFEHPEDAAATDAIKREVMATGVGSRREVLIRDNGVDRFYDLLVDPLRGADGGISGVTCAAIEITERRQAEKALRESEARLKMTQDAGRIGSWDWDLAGGRLHWSETQCLLFGVDPAAREDVDIEAWRGSLHPDDLGPAEEQRQAHFESGDDSELEYRIVKPDGVRWIQSRAHLYRDGHGRPVRVVGVTLDVTDRHERDAALRDFAAQLEVRVREEISAREAAQRRAVHAERMQALGQLAGGVAHDFNNVLQAVMSAWSLIERRPNDPEFIRRIAKLGGEASGRGASITGRLLAFARRGELRAEALDVAVVLSGIAEILRCTLGAAIEVRLEIGVDLPPTMADRGQLEAVLVNLATNARDAMPDGGVVTISARVETLDAKDAPRLGLLTPGPYVRIEVADTGVGMDADTLARASEPFFTTKGPGIGTGLGLSMAHGCKRPSPRPTRRVVSSVRSKNWLHDDHAIARRWLPLR